MLQELFIENIAVIEKTSILLSEGFNVFTGETGAGKSVLIGSINAILGERVNRDLVRTGAEKASVTAVFSSVSPKVLKKLDELGFPTEEPDLILSREITADGRSTCRINGRPATVGALREIGFLLINVHGQHDNQELLSQEVHLSYIDAYGELGEDVAKYQQAFSVLQQKQEAFKSLEMDEKEKQERVDLLSYQVEEIEGAQLEVGEEKQLEKDLSAIRNAAHIMEALNKAHVFLHGDDDGEMTGAVEEVDLASDALEEITDVYADVENVSNRLRELFYELEEQADVVSTLLTSFEYSPAELDSMEERLNEIQKLTRKYGNNVEEVLEYLVKSQEELENIQMADTIAEKLSEEINLQLEICQSLADQITEKRKKAAKDFCAAVGEELEFLDMGGVTLTFEHEKVPLYSKGQDKMQFLISANLGEAPKPVSKVASGGELARIMLSIKSVLADRDEVETLIFDEVDTGVSGRAAEKIGLKLREVSKGRQVISVTHLAQVAALSDEHLLIYKKTENDRTYTEVKTLSRDGRVHELARIIGGEKVTDLTLQHAEEMLTLAAEKEKPEGEKSK